MERIFDGARRLPGAHPGRIVGKGFSLKSGRHVWWESSLERDAHRFAEWSPTVVSYRSQPMTLKYMWCGRQRRYTPDLLVTGAGRILVEVKPLARTRESWFADWEASVRDACLSAGFHFEIWTESELRRTPRQSNIDLLLRYQTQPIPTEISETVEQVVAQAGGIAFNTLCSIVGGGARRRVYLYALMARHRLAYDIDTRIGPEMVLTDPQHG